MSTLLLRLAGPLQSWGTDSKFEVRRTDKEPSKSGVIGLLAAALGRKRNDSLTDLNALRFGIRVDKEGELLRDFHTARHPSDQKRVYITTRYYLSDAIFLVGLESDDNLFLEKLMYALKNPVFPLFLGRRSCPITLPLVLGIREGNLETVLKQEPSLSKSTVESYRIICDAVPGERYISRKKDVPVSFSPFRRQYGYRAVSEKFISLSDSNETNHDPMKELR